MLALSTHMHFKRFFHLFIWEREGERERERHTEGEEKQTPHWAGSLMLAQSQDPEIMTWAKGRYLTDWATEVSLSLFFLKIYLLIWESERESEHKWGEGQRERNRILKQILQTSMRKEPLTWGSIPGSWDHDLSQRQILNWLSHPGAPKHPLLYAANPFRKKMTMIH